MTPKHLQDLYAELLVSGRTDGSGGLSARSVRLAHQVLRLALERAADWRLIARNPAAVHLDLPRMQHRPMQTWTAEEARAFLAATAGDRLGVLWSLMVSTGLWRGETLGLRWEDIDLTAGRLSVVQTVVVASNKAYLSEPKPAAGRRSVSLYPEITAALGRHQVRQDAERHLVGTAWQEAGLVFATSLGTLIHPRNVASDFHAAVRRTGARAIRLHDYPDIRVMPTSARGACSTRVREPKLSA